MLPKSAKILHNNLVARRKADPPSVHEPTQKYAVMPEEAACLRNGKLAKTRTLGMSSERAVIKTSASSKV